MWKEAGYKIHSLWFLLYESPLKRQSYSDPKQINSFQRPEIRGGRYQKDMSKLFHILKVVVVVVVPWITGFAKTHWTTYVRSVNFTVHKLYFNKADCKKEREGKGEGKGKRKGRRKGRGGEGRVLLWQFVLCQLSKAKTVPQSSLPSMVPRESWPGERTPMTQGWGSWEKMQIPVCPIGSSLFSHSSICIQIFFPNASPADLKWLQGGPRLRGSCHKPPHHPFAKSFFANQSSVAVWLPGVIRAVPVFSRCSYEFRASTTDTTVIDSIS